MKSELKSINEMTLAELEHLESNVHLAIQQKRDKDDDEKKKEFFDSEGTVIREKLDKLRKEHVELCKAKHKVTISAEVSLSLEGTDFDSLFHVYNSSHEASEIFEVELKTELLNKKDFDREIVEEIELRLDDIASEACFEATKLNSELNESLENFTEEVNQILQDLEEFDVDDEERSKLLKPIRVAKKTVAKKGKK